ncbi:MAG: beta strand repeat-containing protein [Nostoc sp.]
MVNRKKSVNRQRQRYQSLVATALLTSSLFQFVAPVLAEGTTAGQPISNEATATYQDPNDTSTTINATSNKVTVTVAEVAGITVTPVGVIDENGGTVGGGDKLYYTYSVKNVGNDPTRFQIPNTATITGGPGAVSGNLEYSTDGGASWVSATANPTGDGAGITPSVPADGSILVRVPVTVQSNAVINDTITVVLGNTPTTNNGQNLPRDPDIRDIYTVDNAGTTPLGEVSGTPANGVREASATDEIKVGETIAPLKSFALATLLKTRGAYFTNATPQITDDKVSYDLSFRVESNDVTGQGITPAPLIGTSIKVDTSTPTTHILVSDAIPAGTALAATPTAPSGWEAVYTTELVTTTANVAQWKRFSTNPLADATALATVKRVGFISNSSITAINPGQTVAGFSIQLAITGNPTTLTINNIGQLFGATPVPANSPAGTQPVPVYDESGDANPSNYDGPLNNMTPPTTTSPANGVPTVLGTVDDGYVDNTIPETGTDPSGNNTGTGPNGEANTFTLKEAVPVDLLNGPENRPDAVGPNTNNDDFSNKSSFVDPNKTFGDTIDPLPVVFINTVKNTGTATSNISLLPTTVAPGTYDDALPIDTLVTINYNSLSKLYVWNGTAFLYDADGSASTTNDRSAIDATSKYFTIPVLNNATQSYGVEVNLPADTQLSTETLKGFPVGVTAFVDDATPGLGLVETQNTTIDRVYTGFLRVVKLSRVLKGTGPDVGAGQDDFETTPAIGSFHPGTGADVLRTPAVGNIVEYQIRYTNISAPQSGTGNAILNADKIVITEDGTKSPSNWALDNDSNGGIDTSNIVGTAKDSGTSTIQFFVGNPATTSSVDQTGTTVNNDVAKYVNNVQGQVAPGVQRTFTIQRKVN